MKRRIDNGERVVDIRRRAGRLREIRTSAGRRFLVVRSPELERLLEVGARLNARDIEKLAGPAARSAGLDLAYRMLKRRDRTEWEVRNALSAEGINAPRVVEEIIETLRRRGYLDDRRFAEGYVSYMMRHRPAGPHLLRRKLQGVGVDGEIIEAVVNDALSGGERDIARGLAARRFDRRIERTRMVRRIHGFLTRRGFTSGVVNDVCAMVLRGEITREDG